MVFATNNVWLIPLGSAVGYAWSDLQPVAAVAFDEFMLWVNSTAPYQNVAGFLDAARGAANELAMAGTASKDTDQVLVRQIEKVGHVAFAYVPFRSGSEVAVQLAGGHVAANVNNPQENIGQWRAGTIRPLCVFSPHAPELRRRRHRRAVRGRTSRRAWKPGCRSSAIRCREPCGCRRASPTSRWRSTGVLAKVRETDEWKAWLRRGSQTDAFLSGPELTDYIAADERWLRGQFAEDGWLVD